MKNRNNVFQAGESQGKSGSFFFFSHDKKFIIKTLQKEEMRTMLKILDSYIDHIVTLDNKSLLVRIYGLFTIENDYFSNIQLLLMENTCQNFHDMNIKLFSFDLKGSIANRRDDIKQGKVLKCMNFVDINSAKKNGLVCLDSEQIEEMYDLIKKDSEWLRDMNLMDYSLYLVIE